MVVSKRTLICAWAKYQHLLNERTQNTRQQRSGDGGGKQYAIPQVTDTVITAICGPLVIFGEKQRWTTVNGDDPPTAL